MPEIVVITKDAEETGGTVVYRERIAPSDFKSEHFTGQLAERVGWAVEDAERIEREDPPRLVEGAIDLDAPPAEVGFPAAALSA